MNRPDVFQVILNVEGPFEIEKVGHKSRSQLSCQTCSIHTISHPIQPVKNLTTSSNFPCLAKVLLPTVVDRLEDLLGFTCPFFSTATSFDFPCQQKIHFQLSLTRLSDLLYPDMFSGSIASFMHTYQRLSINFLSALNYPKRISNVGFLYHATLSSASQKGILNVLGFLSHKGSKKKKLGFLLYVHF